MTKELWDEKFRRHQDIGPHERELSEGARAALGHFSKCGARSVLDVACGNGKDSVFLAKEGGFDVTGIDFSAEGIRLASERAMQAGVKARFVIGDVRMMQFADSSFDAALCNGILTVHLEKERRMIAAEIVRVLGRGGALVVCEPAFADAPKKESGVREVEKGTFAEKEQDHLHHYFSGKELELLFAGVNFEEMKNAEAQWKDRKRKMLVMLGRKA